MLVLQNLMPLEVECHTAPHLKALCMGVAALLHDTTLT